MLTPWCVAQTVLPFMIGTLHLTIMQGQYIDGLRTPLVLHPAQETYQYNEEFTVILGDWYHDEHSTLIKQFISIANPGGAEPIPGQC